MVEIGSKNWFSAYFESFLIHDLLHPSSYAQRFWQMKDFSKIYICGKFHWYSICGCEVKSFQSFSYWFSIHEMVYFWGI